MKLLIISALLLVIFVSYSTAQWQKCHDRQWNARCWGAGHQGRGGAGCRGHVAYYYDRNARQCRPMFYRGCGGNMNRYCSRMACMRACGGWSG